MELKLEGLALRGNLYITRSRNPKAVLSALAHLTNYPNGFPAIHYSTIRPSRKSNLFLIAISAVCEYGSESS